MNRKMFGLLLALLLLCAAGCSLFRGEETAGTERALLCQFRQGCRYATNGDQYWEEKDPAWNLYWLVLDDQRTRPQEIIFTFTEDEERDVFALNKDYQMIWKRTLGKGEHRVEASDNMMGIAFAVRNGEPFQPIGTGMHPPLETPFTGQKLSVLGDSVSAFAGYIPWADYAYYSNANFGAASMWWAVLAENTGMELCNINAISGSGLFVPVDTVPGRVLIGNSERCENLSSQQGEDPDVILVLLSGNDYLKQYPVSRIRQEYLEMLARIQRAYPQADLYVCTYFQSPAIPSVHLEELNGLIREVAAQAGAKLIDLEDCGILESEPKKYLIDEVLHPNERGQILMGTRAAQQLLESGADA